MIKDLVSLITPAYNTGHLIYRLLDSVLNQDYPNIEMFVIDDGSTDNTKEVVESYIPKFKNKIGCTYSLHYVFQKNQGQSVAINNGLKLISGEFLAWPDSDDFYAKNNSISILVNHLKQANEDIAFVQGNYKLVDEEVLCEISIRKNVSYKNQFEACVFDNFNFCPGGYFVKTIYIDRFIKNREIYTEKNAGQNWQMLLPILYNKKIMFIDDILYTVVVRKSSHSRGQYKTCEQVIAKYESYENTLLETLKKIEQMPETEKDFYSKKIKQKYANVYAQTYIQHLKYIKAFLVLRQNNSFFISLIKTIKYIVNRILDFIYLILKKIKIIEIIKKIKQIMRGSSK